MRTLLVLATYPRSAAATRFRACGYFPALAERGIRAELVPFLDETFLARFYEPGRRAEKALELARASAARLLLAARSRRYGGIFVQREAALIGPAWIEALLVRGQRLPMVFDFDDAVWVEDTKASRHPIAARVLKSPKKTRALIGMAREVVAGSRYLASYAEAIAPSTPITVLPTVVSRELFVPLPGRLDGKFGNEVPTIGWIGSHSTAGHLDVAIPALHALAREGHRFRVRLVGAARTVAIEGIDVESVPWREETEASEYQHVDVGIAPSLDDAWSRGKCAFKQIQYMAVGAPMVSSPIGAASELLEHGKTAMLASSTEDWIAHLRALLTQEDLRARLACAGRRLVEEKLCLEVQAPVFADVIDRVLGS